MIISICKTRDRLYLELAWFTILNPLLQHRYNTDVNSSPCQTCNTIPYHPIKSPSFVKHLLRSQIGHFLSFMKICNSSAQPLNPGNMKNYPRGTLVGGAFKLCSKLQFPTIIFGCILRFTYHPSTQHLSFYKCEPLGNLSTGEKSKTCISLFLLKSFSEERAEAGGAISKWPRQ